MDLLEKPNALTKWPTFLQYGVIHCNLTFQLSLFSCVIGSDGSSKGDDSQILFLHLSAQTESYPFRSLKCVALTISSFHKMFSKTSK